MMFCLNSHQAPGEVKMLITLLCQMMMLKRKTMKKTNSMKMQLSNRKNKKSNLLTIKLNRTIFLIIMIDFY